MSWDWSTLIAGLGGGVIGGGLTVVAGFMAYKGVQSQIADLQTERTETDRRRLSVIKWAVMAEARRLERAPVARLGPMPSEETVAAGSQPGRLPPERLVIESSPLLRVERAEIALLDEPTRERLALLASIVHEYNAHIETQPLSDMTGGSVVITEHTLSLIRRVFTIAGELYASYEARR